MGHDEQQTTPQSKHTSNVAQQFPLLNGEANVPFTIGNGGINRTSHSLEAVEDTNSLREQEEDISLKKHPIVNNHDNIFQSDNGRVETQTFCLNERKNVSPINKEVCEGMVNPHQ